MTLKYRFPIRSGTLGLTHAVMYQGEMIHHGLRLDVRSYSSLIGAAALAGDLPAAEGFFESMTGASHPHRQKDNFLSKNFFWKFCQTANKYFLCYAHVNRKHSWTVIQTYFACTLLATNRLHHIANLVVYGSILCRIRVMSNVSKNRHMLGFNEYTRFIA